MPTRKGSIRLFQLFGIEVYLHWSWFAMAYFRYRFLREDYRSPAWYMAEYVTLFLIVLLHEFGHALACRQVGGQANLIVLWPFGGVAYVPPPQRPGAMLWGIAAGPLVNVILLPILGGLWLLGYSAHWYAMHPNAYLLVRNMAVINLIVLMFNLLPVFPLDGGQILRSLLWYVFGRARSLQIATVVGFVGVAALLGTAYLLQSPWLGILAAFVLLNCWQSFQYAQALSRLEAAPRRTETRVPASRR